MERRAEHVLKKVLDNVLEVIYRRPMTKRTPKQQPNVVPSALLGAHASRIIEDAKKGKRTLITHYNILVAAVVSADDLKQLEAGK